MLSSGLLVFHLEFFSFLLYTRVFLESWVSLQFFTLSSDYLGTSGSRQWLVRDSHMFLAKSLNILNFSLLLCKMRALDWLIFEVDICGIDHNVLKWIHNDLNDWT